MITLVLTLMTLKYASGHFGGHGGYYGGGGGGGYRPPYRPGYGYGGYGGSVCVPYSGVCVSDNQCCTGCCFYHSGDNFGLCEGCDQEKREAPPQPNSDLRTKLMKREAPPQLRPNQDRVKQMIKREEVPQIRPNNGHLLKQLMKR